MAKRKPGGQPAPPPGGGSNPQPKKPSNPQNKPNAPPKPPAVSSQPKKPPTSPKPPQPPKPSGQNHNSNNKPGSTRGPPQLQSTANRPSQAQHPNSGANPKSQARPPNPPGPNKNSHKAPQVQSLNSGAPKQNGSEPTNQQKPPKPPSQNTQTKPNPSVKQTVTSNVPPKKPENGKQHQQGQHSNSSKSSSQPHSPQAKEASLNSNKGGTSNKNTSPKPQIPKPQRAESQSAGRNNSSSSHKGAGASSPSSGQPKFAADAHRLKPLEPKRQPSTANPTPQSNLQGSSGKETKGNIFAAASNALPVHHSKPPPKEPNSSPVSKAANGASSNNNAGLSTGLAKVRAAAEHIPNAGVWNHLTSFFRRNEPTTPTVQAANKPAPSRAVTQPKDHGKLSQQQSHTQPTSNRSGSSPATHSSKSENAAHAMRASPPTPKIPIEGPKAAPKDTAKPPTPLTRPLDIKNATPSRPQTEKVHLPNVKEVLTKATPKATPKVAPTSPALAAGQANPNFFNRLSSLFYWAESKSLASTTSKQGPKAIDRQLSISKAKNAGPSNLSPSSASASQASKPNKVKTPKRAASTAATASSTSKKRDKSPKKTLILNKDAAGLTGKEVVLSLARKPGRKRTDRHVVMKVASGTPANESGKSSQDRSGQQISTIEVTLPTASRRKGIRLTSGSSKVFSGPKKAQLRDRKKLALRQYSRDLVWRKSDNPTVVSALATETAAPLPSPPANELRNKVALRTIKKHPELFKITTPVKVERFEKLLKNHPNQPFVKSVIRGLKKGFWPLADTSNPQLPVTLDNSQKNNFAPERAEFIRQQRDEEIRLGRWSKSFGKKLLPGMYSSPIAVVPKSTPGKFRLIVDQSRGKHSLNSMIPKSQVKVKLDDIHDLGTALIAVRKKHGTKKKLVVFKSDVKSAYRLMPMHPLWQIRQAVTVDNHHYIDRNNSFGSRASGWIWNSFISLVLWIASEEKGIPDLLGYVDDDFSWEFKDKKRFYKPYKKYLPAKQARYLELWDELGIPHDEDKQLFGSSLPIIGYDVDPNEMVVRVPSQKKAEVVQLIRSAAHEGRTYDLEQLQSLSGSVSRIVNMYPHLRPRLRVLFDQMARREGPRSKLTVTKDMARHMAYVANYIEHADGVSIEKVAGKRGNIRL